MKRQHWLAVILLGMAAVVLSLWLARAFLVARYARSYFHDHGVDAQVDIGSLGLSGISGRFTLGPADAPDFSAEQIELKFDPLQWKPVVVEVRLIHPTVRVRITGDGKVMLGSLQDWIVSLNRQPGKSQFVGDNLAVSLTGLRALLTTPAGAVEVYGDIRLRRDMPLSAALHVQPARLIWKGADVTLRAASLNYRGSTARIMFSGDAAYAGQTVRAADATLDISGLRWSGQNLSARLARLQASAQASGLVSQPRLDMTIHNLAVAGDGVSADLSAAANGGIHSLIIIPHDAALTRAVATNLARLELNVAGHIEKRGPEIAAQFSAPIVIRGAQGAALRLTGLTLSGAAGRINASFKAALGGGGLPSVTASVARSVWGSGGFAADASLDTRFSYGMLHDVALSDSGALSWQSGRYAFMPKTCGRVRLAAFRPGASDLARNIQAAICPSGAQPLIAGKGTHWKFSGNAQDVSAFLPLANAQANQAAGQLDFAGQGGDFHGQVSGLAGRMSDKTEPVRFKPLLGTGAVALAGGVWRGQFAVSSESKIPLGAVTFQHVMATGSGMAHIDTPHLVFAPDKFAPEDLSPLLAAFRKANGNVDFQGDIAWTRDALTSHGTLNIASLDFLTPLGTAHAIRTKLEFTSLLPPRTAEDQQISIGRVDWTLPFSDVDLRFSFDPALLKVSALSSGWASGKASLDAFTVNPAQPGKMAGAAQFQSITLESLIAVSNLGSKIGLVGKISGRVPFTLGGEGLRIAGGHIASDGPGRLSVNRSVWAQGDAAISSNAVQDFAYQALENLAFDSLSADLNSVAGGRLQVIFHIKGKSDPPRPQTADVAITDILNGTALYKPIPLPSGTPIDLTLDTSLNFDELLKSYAEAWSKSLNPRGAADAPGAKP